MFTKEQIETLNSELDLNRVKNRSKGNVNLSYLEGFDIFETANSIFGFGNWSYTITSLEQVSQEYNQNENIVLCHKAIVNLKAFDISHKNFIEKEDVGFGTGISKTLADANESASKEAVTDAIKRAFRSFGNQFGNSLYDKSRVPTVNNVPNSITKKTTQNINNANHSSFKSLHNVGLNVVENNGYYLVTGDDIFFKKSLIKSCGFNWDSKSKVWFKQIEQEVA